MNVLPEMTLFPVLKHLIRQAIAVAQTPQCCDGEFCTCSHHLDLPSKHVVKYIFIFLLSLMCLLVFSRLMLPTASCATMEDSVAISIQNRFKSKAPFSFHVFKRTVSSLPGKLVQSISNKIIKMLQPGKLMSLSYIIYQSHPE